MSDPASEYRGRRGMNDREETEEERDKRDYEAWFSQAAASYKTRPKAMFRGVGSPIFPIKRPK